MMEIQSARSVLIVSSTEKSARIIGGLLNPSLCYPVYYVKTGSETRRKVQNCQYDLILVNTPLSDEFGHELAADLARQTCSGVILLAKSDIYDEMCDRVEEDGVLTIAKPISGQLFGQAVRLAITTSLRLSEQEKEKQKLKNKIDELRIIGRAKCLLIEERKMSEAQAHRYIEKQAMDSRMTRKEVAEIIIRTYKD